MGSLTQWSNGNMNFYTEVMEHALRNTIIFPPWLSLAWQQKQFVSGEVYRLDPMSEVPGLNFIRLPYKEKGNSFDIASCEG